MKQFKLSIFLTLFMSMVGATVFAHDIAVANSAHFAGPVNGIRGSHFMCE